MATTARANRIARTVLAQFDKLPAKRKPTVRDNGVREWVPLSGIVAECEGQLTCLALATGMKCLPASKLNISNGNAVHDWHAEVLAVRAFNRFLLDECLRSPDASAHSVVSRTPGSKPYGISSNVRLHMYCSEAPCGDASMELTMDAQQDASPWEAPEKAQDQALPGRAYFSQLGIVRRKPSRPDAPPTLSKSCSDKLALKQCTSLLSSLSSLLVDPFNAYIDSLVLPSTEYSATGCKRSFQDRMSMLIGKSWPGGYAFKPFTVETTDESFAYSRKAALAQSDKVAPSNLAAVWTASGIEETILGGVMQGHKPYINKGASGVSRRKTWMAARDVASASVESHDVLAQLLSTTYEEVKNGPLLANRRKVKSQVKEAALQGWIRNEGDSNFTLDSS